MSVAGGGLLVGATARPSYRPRHAQRAGVVKDLLRTADLGAANVRRLLDLAADLKREPLAWRDLLGGDTVVLYFNKPSTRTRISFETAVARLGGVPVAVGTRELQLGRGETIEDTARVVGAYARAFVVRTFADEDVRRVARATTIPVVNALTDGHHPCQSLADVMTLGEELGGLAGRRVAYVGDGDNVAHSLMEACALLGVDIGVATPRGYEPDAEVVSRAAALASRHGSTVVVTNDPYDVVGGADAVYTDVWLSMDVPDEEREERMEAFRRHRVDRAMMEHAAPHAVFLHCLPAHRGEEVTSEVIDGPASRVFQQAANRLPTEQAVLVALLTGMLPVPADEDM